MRRVLRAARTVDGAIRLLKGSGLGSIFLLLTLPLVALSNCSPAVDISGYQALAGVGTLAESFDMPPPQHPEFGPDWWVAAIMVLALLGMAIALRGGLKGAAAGIGAALAGLVALGLAVGYFGPPQGNQYWEVNPAYGGTLIGLIFACSIFLDLLWISWRSWSEIWRNRRAPRADRGDWYGLGLAATFFLIHIGAAVTALAALAIVSKSHA